MGVALSQLLPRMRCEIADQQPPAGSQNTRRFLYRGIANRSFERSFQLAEHVKVTGAELKNGLLDIELKREVPEAMKPRRILVNQDQVVDSRSKAA